MECSAHKKVLKTFIMAAIWRVRIKSFPSPSTLLPVSLTKWEWIFWFGTINLQQGHWSLLDVKAFRPSRISLPYSTPAWPAMGLLRYAPAILLAHIWADQGVLMAKWWSQYWQITIYAETFHYTPMTHPKVPIPTLYPLTPPVCPFLPGSSHLQWVWLILVMRLQCTAFCGSAKWLLTAHCTQHWQCSYDSGTLFCCYKRLCTLDQSKLGLGCKSADFSCSPAVGNQHHTLEFKLNYPAICRHIPSMF